MARVLITGANRGIGAGLLAACRMRGDTVTGTSRRAGAGLAVMDLTRPETITALATGQGDGGLDLLVCNAGIYPDKGLRGIGDYTAEIWAAAFAANVTGTALTIAAFLPHLRKARGKIAILSSAMASDARAPGGSYAYRASKAAVLNLGRNLAADLRGDGIAVGIYHPGWVRTDMGGSGATVDVADAVQGLLARFAGLSLATTGCFEDWQGAPIPY